MNETYVECLVARKSSGIMSFLKILLIMLTVVFVLVGMVFVPGLLVAIVTGIGAYFAYMNADVEYEYLYLDKEITVDKIMAKTRRKRVLTIDVNKIEILAPEKSYQLDSYRNRQVKATDFSAGHDLPDQKLYVMFYEGSQKYLLNLTEDFAKTVKGIIPRKVFLD